MNRMAWASLIARFIAIPVLAFVGWGWLGPSWMSSTDTSWAVAGCTVFVLTMIAVSAIIFSIVHQFNQP